MLEEAKGEKVKHAMSALLVDILTPVAAVIKYEMSMPAVRKLVSTLYSYFYDQSKKLRHSTVSTIISTIWYECTNTTVQVCTWICVYLDMIVFHFDHNYSLVTITTSCRPTSP